MKSWKQKPLLMWLLLAGMLVMLPLLAVLQYRWLGEVSQAERERMQANLKTSAERFCSDFDRELTAIYTRIQNMTEPGFNKPADILSNDFAVRYSRWLANNQKTKFISEVYRTGFDAEGKLALAHFKNESGLFEFVDWPKKLEPLRLRLEAQQQAHESAQTTLRNLFGNSERPRFPSGQGLFLQIQSGVIADEVPALVVPDAHPPKLNSVLAQKSVCTVVVLNADFIKNELLPTLVKRHFSADGQSEFNLAVVRRANAKDLVFQTDASLPANAFDKSDAQSTLFKIRMDEADKIMIRSIGSETISAPPQPLAPAAPKGDDKVTMRVMRSEVVKQSNNVQIDLATADRIAFASQLPNLLADNEGWRLLVKHRSGSLEAAVGNVRRRNLAISFGILLLLGVSVGFIVLSSRRAERLAAQQMEFVAGVSHELRTPLAVICSAAENLADGVIDNRDQIKRYGGLIRDEGRRLTGMVEQVLEFAGAQSGRKTYELRPTDLNHVIEDAIAACHLQLIEGGFELEKNIPADLPMVNADAAALSRAIQNLLNNAMKYSGDSRWIGLSAESVKTDNGDEVQIKVSDRGLGIAASELSHIFEPFYRGKEVVASQIHGNGLGLSLVKHIVEAHQGRLAVVSKIGAGSVFCACLQPLSEKAAQEFALKGQDEWNQCQPETGH
ncbi:MAG: HAMP domain-containing sensor histidine kinase [Acidobacteriota bacterium]|nr:HAMP domain-containing sensor histidine kinase [Acidobacteriota bacterium]